MFLLYLCMSVVAITTYASLPTKDLTPRLILGGDFTITFKFCDTDRRPCKDCPSGTPTAALVDLDDINTADLFPDVEVTLTRDELDKYRALEMEYVVEFSKNPPFSEEPVDLPFCVVDQVQYKSRRSFVTDLFGNPPKRPTFKPRCLPTSISATIFFNIITGNSTTGKEYVTNDTITRQFDILQSAYQPLGISFRNGGTERLSGSAFMQFTHQKHEVALNQDEQSNQDEVLKKLRRGGYEDINIYIVEQIDDTRCIDDKGSRTAGYCQFPKTPSVANVLHDGCFVDIDSLPGVAFRGGPGRFGTGTILVHEVGHWFGLRHIFHSDRPAVKATCDKSPDYLGVETPFYPGPGQFDAFQRRCCPLGPDLFGDCPGGRIDHVTNWMSYSRDKGKLDFFNNTFPWTKGQKADIFAKFFSLRKQFKGVSCEDGGPMFFDGIFFKDKSRKKKRDGDGDQLVTGKLSELLRQPPALLESLKTICARDQDESKDVDIDPGTGKLVKVNDGLLGWWFKLGIWKWVVLTAVIVGLLVVFFASFYCCWHWRNRRGYRELCQREAEKYEAIRMASLSGAQQDSYGPSPRYS